MFTKNTRIALVLAVGALVAACGKSEDPAAAKSGAAAPAPAPVATATTTPDAAFLAGIHAIRANDINAALTAFLPATEVAKIKADWTKNLTKDPVTDEDRKKFSDTITLLTAPGAEDKIMAQIEPQLAKFDTENAAQVPMMIAMGQGVVQSTLQQSKDMSDEQKKQAGAFVDAMAKWATGVKFTDRTMVKGVIAVVCKTARDLNLKSIDEARALTYDQGMLKAGIALGGLKQALAVYGLQMDKALDSVKAETVSTTGDAAKVKVTYSAFDQTFTSDNDLVKVDGKWYGKQAIEKWQKEQAEAASDAAAAAPAAK